jgi:phage terminase small subunit
MSRPKPQAGEMVKKQLTKVTSKKAAQKAVPSVSTKLTPQQKMFCKSRAKGKSATQAAIDAGYSPKTARQIGSKLLTKVDIQQGVEQEAQKAQQKLDYKDTQHFQELTEIQEMAKKRGNISVALNAIVQKGKLCGLYIEKQEVSIKEPRRFVFELKK